MAAVAFANSVRHACPACAWASGRSPPAHRVRRIRRIRFPCLPSDRRSAARPFRLLCFGKRGGRVWGAWGISRPGEGRPADPCRFCIREKGKCVFRTRAGAGSIMKAHRGAPRVARVEEASPALPVLHIGNGRTRFSRMGNFPAARSPPRRPRVVHREIFGENAFCP